MKARTERENETPSCAAVAPLLTALFDGEADAHATHSARAHLLSCERCARAWLDWNQHRAILRNESVPAPPPTLMWRVLVACRLAGLARPKKSAHPATPKAALLRDGLFRDPALPTDFSARILAQTTRREQPTRSPQLPVGSHKMRPRLVAWSSLAMPAVAAWMILLGQNSQFGVPDTRLPEADSTALATPNATEGALSASLGGRASRAQIARGKIQAVARGESTDANRETGGDAAVDFPLTLRRAPVTPPSIRSAPVIESREATVHAPEIRNQVSKSRSVSLRIEARPAASPRDTREVPRESSALTRAEAPERITPVATHANAPISTPVRPILAGLPHKAPAQDLAAPRRATLSDEVRSPRSRMARPVIAALASEDHTALRPSRPLATTVAAPRLAALDTPDVAEEHAEEWRSVVNGFRSAVSGDEDGDSLESDAN